MNIEEGTYYEPPGSVDPLRLKSPPPKSGVRLNKRAIIATSLSLALVIGVVLLFALSPGENPASKLKPNSSSPLPGEVVQSLPSDYSKIPRKPPAAERPKHSEESVAKHALSDEEKIFLDYKLTKIKRAIKARESELSFKSVESPSINYDGTEKLRMDSAKITSSSDIEFSGSSDGGSSTFSLRDNSNRQDDKSGFLSKIRPTDPYLTESIISPVSKFEIKAGTVIPGVLLTGINSDLPGQIVGQISQRIFDSKDGQYVLIPQGTKVIGEYDSTVTYGQERVLIVWTRLIFPNGESISLKGMPGVDLSGYAGLSDQVNHHYVRLLTGVVFGSLLGAGAQVARGSNRDVNPSYGQLALEGVAQNTNQAGQEITRRNLEVQPTLEIRPGYKFSVFVTKDIVLKPYSES